MSTSTPTSGASPWSAWRLLKSAGGHALLVLVSIGVWYTCLLVVAALMLRSTNSGLAGTAIVSIVPVGSAVLDPGDMDALARALPGTTLGRAVVASHAAYTATSPAVAVQTVDSAFFDVYAMHAAEGSLFTPNDDVRSAPVAVLGSHASDLLFADVSSPVGRSLTIQNVAFTVVGVLAPVDDTSFDASVFVPLQTGRVRLVGVRAPTEVVINTTDPSVAETATRVLTARYRADVPFDVRTQAMHGASPSFSQVVVAAADRVRTEFLRGKGFPLT